MGENEPIGRRLFDEPMLVGGGDQRPLARLDLRHFLESRDRELSFDRLGRTSVDRSVVKYLCFRGIAAGSRFKKPKKFNGWVYFRARRLATPPRGPKMIVIASPEFGEPPNDNPYHAHVDLPYGDAYISALHIRELFEKGDRVQGPDDGVATQTKIFTLAWWRALCERYWS